jgi:hypothetical protein
LNRCRACHLEWHRQRQRRRHSARSPSAADWQIVVHAEWRLLLPVASGRGLSGGSVAARPAVTVFL